MTDLGQRETKVSKVGLTRVVLGTCAAPATDGRPPRREEITQVGLRGAKKSVAVPLRQPCADGLTAVVGAAPQTIHLVVDQRFDPRQGHQIYEGRVVCEGPERRGQVIGRKIPTPMGWQGTLTIRKHLDLGQALAQIARTERRFVADNKSVPLTPWSASNVRTGAGRTWSDAKTLPRTSGDK
jgi:hypothetical protein